MPSIGIDTLTATDKVKVLNYDERCDWETKMFGPPPGISKRRKLHLGRKRFIRVTSILCKTLDDDRCTNKSCFFLLDEMNDRDYIYSFLRMIEPRQQTIMISEAEPCRTFAVL